MQYEERIIDPILNCIKEHQEYLTQKENLPQLAKLGYMYHTLWGAGRIASYNDIISKQSVDEGDGEIYYYDQCNDNPKYKIEMCEPINEKIEDYIYDAWGMHVDNGYGSGWVEFMEIMTNKHSTNSLESKLLKSNKTFDEWVEILTDPEYKYSSIFPDRMSVANHLLCVIGTGYGFRKGFVIEKAGGADQDTTDYGDWKNAKFNKDIQKVVDKILNDPEVEKVLKFVEEKKEKHQKEEEEKEIKSFGMPYKEYVKKNKETFQFRSKRKFEYYSISDSSNISKINKNSHLSYIQAGLEVCEYILENPPKYKENYNNYQKKQCDYQVEFAKKFIEKFSKK
jgi:hypothetical protein